MKIEQWLDTDLGRDIWAKKYRHGTETFEEWVQRVSGGDEDVAQLIKEQKFLFGGRILANRGLAGSTKLTYSNCYVLKPPGDSIEEIYETASKLARTFSYGGGVGIDISELRPEGYPVNNAAKTTSGAVSFMDTFEQVSRTIGQAGRRGALMLSMSCEHPDIEKFIDAKLDNKLEKCNISVRMTDDFMREAQEEGNKESDILDHLSENNWNWAEPGILYWDTIEQYNILSKFNNFKYAGVNPCIVGDTIIQTTDGPIPIKDLVGKTPDVLCMSDDGSLVIKKAEKVWKTRKDAELVKVIHHRGELICTPDHLIYTRNRGWVKAIELQPKDKLNGLGISMNSERHCAYKLSTDKKYHSAHRFILSHYVNIKGKDVHHLDDNPLNNSRQNLVALSHSMHSQITNLGHECYAIQDEVTGRFIEGETGRRSENLEINKDVTGKNFIVKEVIKLDYREDVYDMTVEDVHNFIANNIVIHNCAEEPLPAGGSCLLGAINLAAFVDKPFTKDAAFNVYEFRKAVKIAVKALNDVLDEGLELHPLQEQRDSVRDWRQIGLGIMGYGDLLLKMGHDYGTIESRQIIKDIGGILVDAGLETSAQLAQLQGAFPACDDTNKLITSNFVKDLADEGYISSRTMSLISKYGLRNSQLFTIAPTGSISTMIGVTGGVEPMFATHYTRKTQALHGEDTYYKVYTPIVQDMLDNKVITEDEVDNIVTAQNIKPVTRVLTQAVWQKFIDASISSTVNLTNDATIAEIRDLYVIAWETGCKGLTIYRAGCSKEGVLVVDGQKAQNVKPSQLERGQWAAIPEDTIYLKRKVYTGCGKLNLFIGWSAKENKVVDMYAKRSGQGGCEHNIDSTVICMSGMLRLGGTLDTVEKAFSGCGACNSFTKAKASGKKLSKGKSCPTAILHTIKDTIENLKELPVLEQEEKLVKEEPTVSCPECGAKLQMTGGCNVCSECGYTKCD